MNAFFKPAVLLMNKLTYTKKLILLGAISLLVVTILTYQLAAQSNTVKDFSGREIYGVNYINPIITVVKSMQKYRQAENAYLNGDPSQKDKISTYRNDVDSAISNANNPNTTQLANVLNTTAQWNKIVASWDEAKKASINSLSKSDIQNYTSIIQELNTLIINACDNSNLTLDPDIDTYYLMDTWCTKMPSFLEEASQIQIIGTSAYASKNLTGNDRDQIVILRALMDDFNKPGIKTNLDKVFNYDPAQGQKLSTLRDTTVDQITSASNVVGSTILANNYPFTSGVQSFSDQFTNLIDNGYRLYDQTGTSLYDLLNVRVDKYQNELRTNLIISVLGMILLAYLFVGVYLSMITGLRKLTDASDKLANGDLSAEVKLDTNDELLPVAESFNVMRNTISYIINETQSVVNSIIQGDLTKRIPVDDKKGYAKELATTINKVNENSQKIIDEIERVLNELSKGNLSVKMSDEYKGTFSDLKNYINTTILSLNNLIRDIKKSTETIHYGAREIALGNSDLSKRTDQQATFIEETSASIDDLTSAVKQNAENAKQANMIVRSASDVAIKGGAVVNHVVNTMTTIHESSKKVSDIIGVIDSIASQTNILALNAAVEAARAGEQGRGFAVVATEIRNLAQRSSSAAKEIKALISTSVENVSDGKKLVDQAGQTMESILNEVKKITEIVGEIATASLEQSNGIEQVNKAITQMDQVVQQNMTLVELAATAAESMEAQTRHMDEVVKTFKLTESEAEKMAVEKPAEVEKLESAIKNIALPKSKGKFKRDHVKTKDEWDEF